MKERSRNEVERDFRRFRTSGDPAAMARVFDAVAPELLLVAGHLVRDAGEAEDLVQTTFLEALRDAGRWDANRPLVPWLVGILSHRAVDLRRRRALRATRELGELVTVELDPQELAADRELQESIAGAIAGLDEPYREVLLLRVTHGLEPTEIAHTLGRSPGTVRMQLRRGRERLERALPRGLGLPALFLADTGRGLAAVREAVLAKAGATAATVSVGTMALGGLWMKTWVAVIGVVALGLVAWRLLGDDRARAGGDVEVAARETGVQAPVAELVPPSATETATNGRKSEPRTTAARPSTVALDVRVVYEEDGRPAADVGVYLRPLRRGALGFETRTEADGSVRFADLARGGYSVDLDRWGRGPRTLDLTRGQSLTLEIPSGVDVEGTVVDRAGAPLPNADVFRLSPDHQDHQQWIAVTDAAGRFHLRDASPDLTLCARAAGHQPSRAGGKGGSRLRGEPGQTVEVRLVLGAKGERVSGVVVDEHGTPQPWARIALAVEEDARREGTSVLNRVPGRHKPGDLEIFPVRADEEGRFETDELPAGNATWFAQTAGGEPLVGVGPLEVLPGIDNAVRLIVAPGARVEGVIRGEDGSPALGHTVTSEWKGSATLGAPEHDLGLMLAGLRATTDESGAFALTGLLPGEQWLEVLHPAGERLVRDGVELRPSEHREWNATVEARTELAVRVLDAEANPVVGWEIRLSRGPLGQSGSVTGLLTDNAGRATFDNLSPEPYLVSLHPPRAEGAETPHAPVLVRENVHPGRPELVLTLDPVPTGALRGRVLTARGEVPRESGRDHGVIQLVRRGFASCGRLALAGDGSFVAERLAGGTYELRLPRPNDLPRDLVLGTFELLDGQDLDIGLLSPVEPASLEVLVLDADGNRLERPRSTLSLASSPERPVANPQPPRDDPFGTARTGPLEPGDYVLTFGSHEPEYAPVLEAVRLEPGEHRLVTLTARRGHEVTFELTLPPHPRRRDDAPGIKIELCVHDAEGRFLLRERKPHEHLDGDESRLRLARRLAPGTWSVFLEDHRDPALRRPRPSAWVEVEVDASGPGLVRVQLR